jgi:hypothetical protein
MQRTEVQNAPLSAIAVEFNDDSGPLTGLPCWFQVDPSEVTNVPFVDESAMQCVLSLHATPLNDCVVPLVPADHVEPVSVEVRIVPAAPAA